jgi:hypothetical protein
MRHHVLLPPQPLDAEEELWFAVGDVVVSWHPRAARLPPPPPIGDALADLWFA